MTKKYGFVLVFLVVACASKAPKIDPNVSLVPIQDYKDIEVKPIESPAADAKPKPTPKPLLIKGAPPVEVTKKKSKKVEAPKIRQPDFEDTEGFEPGSRRPIKDPFRVGEKITMTLTYFNVAAGDAVMEIRPFVEVNGRKSYHFYSTMKSSSLFSMFYSVDDWCESYIDYEEMIPYNFTLAARETKQIRDQKVRFDWSTGWAHLWEQKYTKEDGQEKRERSWQLFPYSQNIYTALQYVRVFALKVGKSYKYRVSDDGSNWDVIAKVERQEKIKTDIGEFDTVVIRPEVAVGGIFQPKGEVLFWYTNDDRHLPVRFESKIKIGTIVGNLKGMEKGE